MKKLIASVTCAFVALASVSAVVDSSKIPVLGVDVVAAATGTAPAPTPQPQPQPQPQTPRTPTTTTPSRTTTTVATGTAPEKLSRQVRLGSSGEDVRIVQGLLVERGYKLAIDGSFGKITLNAVKSFQKSNALKVDGWVGPQTYAKLRGDGKVLIIARIIKYGYRGEDVKLVQTLLNTFGYKLKVDGSYGKLTQSAVKDFQKKNGLKADGIVNGATFTKLKVNATTTPTPTPAPAPVVYKYQDGVYVAYSDASSKGNEAARVTIKNDKIVDIEFMRLSPKMIDREASASYAGLWPAFEAIKQRLIGKTYDQAKTVSIEVDAVSGATSNRSSEAWMMALDRAFVRAAVTKTAGETYFEGTHMGVDPQGKFAVFATFDKTRLTGVKVYPFENGSIKETNNVTYAYGLLEKGLAMATPDADSKAVVNAFWDAEQNAKINNTAKYVDGWYSGYAGGARDKGEEKAEVYIRNGKLVDVKLYRLGADLKDRGASAYASVVAANAPMVAKFLERGFYIENFVAKNGDTNVDSISGATESTTHWNIAVQRAFERAQKTSAANAYSNGTFAGVDNQSRMLVVVTMNNNVPTAVNSYLFDTATNKIISATNLTDAQKGMLAQINAGLLGSGKNMPNIVGFEAMSAVARAAYEDMLANASTKQGQYKDGTFVVYNGSYDKGSQRTEVMLRNGKVVGLNLQRVSVTLEDRGSSAYKPLVANIPVFLKNFMNAATLENVKKVDIHIANADANGNPVYDANGNKIDGVTGATSGHSGEAFKEGIEIAFSKAEIAKSKKFAYNNGIFAANDTAKSVYVMVTVENNLPKKLELYFLGADGKIIAETALTEAQKAAKAEILNESNVGKILNKLSFTPSAANKPIFDAVNQALKTALGYAAN